MSLRILVSMVVKISVCVFLRMFVFQWQKHKTENSLFLRLLEGAMLISHQAFAGVHERNHPGLNYISWEVLWLSTQFPKLFRRLLLFILRKDDIQQQIFTSSWIYRPKCWQDHSGSEFYEFLASVFSPATISTPGLERCRTGSPASISMWVSSPPRSSLCPCLSLPLLFS